MTKYLFRIDDVHPKMDWGKFDALRGLFDEYKIKPIVAIVPDNQDTNIDSGKERRDFWRQMRELHSRGWTVGVHGYQHQLRPSRGGILKLNRAGEFDGLDLSVQSEKIKKAKAKFEEEKLPTDLFIAPAHSLDKQTLEALRATGFKYISDGIALWPFKKLGLVWVPQIAWIPRKTMPFGIVTFCLHPQTINQSRLDQIRNFLINNQSQITNFETAIEIWEDQSTIEKIFKFLINSIFKFIWYVRFRFLKRKNKSI